MLRRKTHRHVSLLSTWAQDKENDKISIHIIKAYDLPKKNAGVGLARKIGMDEAVRRFEAIGNRRGIMACFDADCTCTNNYLLAIQQFYTKNPHSNAALVYFEHPLSGELSDEETYRGILHYELHLRYLKNALQYTTHPFSYYTIGSCISVTSKAYQKQGGMNKRKAGEDFYFLQKIAALGPLGEINSATVYPSPRASDRVPFGTGKAINDLLVSGPDSQLTYHPDIFKELKGTYSDSSLLV